MINLNINFYLDENYFYSYLFSMYTHCKMHCHYVEKRIYLIQTHYPFMQLACQKQINQVILLIYRHLSFFYPSNRSGETGEQVGNNSPEIGEMQGGSTNHE